MPISLVVQNDNGVMIFDIEPDEDDRVLLPEVIAALNVHEFEVIDKATYDLTIIGPVIKDHNGNLTVQVCIDGKPMMLSSRPHRHRLSLVRSSEQ